MLRGETGQADPLTVAEILALDLSGVDLVVLAACESSFRSTALATHALGLGEAFLAAGVDAVVASGWKVDDLATRRLMSGFYGALAAGAQVGEALREAQLGEIVASPRTGPRDAGAFRILGNPAIVLKPQNQED